MHKNMVDMRGMVQLIQFDCFRKTDKFSVFSFSPSCSYNRQAIYFSQKCFENGTHRSIQMG